MGRTKELADVQPWHTETAFPGSSTQDGRSRQFSLFASETGPSLMTSALVNMYRLLSPVFRVAVVAVLGATTGTSPLFAQAKPICTPYPKVDLGTASVAGLPMDTTIGFLQTAIGSANIRRYTVDSEGGPMPVYTLRICGHKLEWYDYGVSWSDSAYRTREGLGVRSTLSALDSALGIGKISGDHGLQVRYELDRYNLYVEVGDCFSFEPGVATVDRSCRVNGMALEEGYRPPK